VTYDSLSLSEVIPARPERIYAAWLSSDEHSAFTGDKAVVEPFVGGKHSTFDGYAVGQTIDLQPGRRIVQTWRAEDFPLGSPDSRVEVTLEETVGGTMVTILHTEIPSGQGGSYRDAWLQYYLEPLKGYFVVSKTNGVPKTAPKIKAKAPIVIEPRAATSSRATVKPAKTSANSKGATKPRGKPKAKSPAKAKPAKAKPAKAKPAKAKAKAKPAKAKPAKAKPAKAHGRRSVAPKRSARAAKRPPVSPRKKR
jgi:uncharacterized protein YndB with AHSA1/START domain